jgi:hypothetical protein
VIADQSNNDFEDTIDEIAEEETYIKEKGLDPAIKEKAVPANPGNNGGDSDGASDEPPAPPAHHSARQPRDRGRFARSAP